MKHALQGAMHVEIGVGTSKAGAKFGGKVGFDGSGAAAVQLGVRMTEVAVGGGHAALASVGEFEVAEVVRIVLASHSGERIANMILVCQYNDIIILGTIYPRVRMLVENGEEESPARWRRTPRFAELSSVPGRQGLKPQALANELVGDL